MQWVVYFGMRVYFPWKIIWNQRFIRMQWVVYFGMRVYLPWETIPDQSLNRMKEQNSKSYLLEFRNIYFNYKFFWLNFRFSYFFMRGACPPQHPIYSKKLRRSFNLHSKYTYRYRKTSKENILSTRKSLSIAF